MHSGHYNAIRQAKCLTDILVVGVHSEKEIRKHKGPPVMSDEERLATVRACKWVDEVVFDTPYDPSLELLVKLNCDYCVHGDDISTTADGKDAFAELKAAGRMKIVKRTEGVSTTDLVGRLLLMTKNHHIKDQSAVIPHKTGVDTNANLITSDVILPDKKHCNSNDGGDSKVAGKPISNFLPTTWRITQFSNHRAPSKEDKIVYIDGAFDLFHVGHIETLKQAKALGTFLYVGIHDDSTVNLHKGRNYPIMNLHERVMNVLSCRYVDEVVIGAPWVVTKDLITTLNLDIVCSGTNTKMDADLEPLVVSSDTSASSSSQSNGRKPMGDAYADPRMLGIFREIETTHALTTEDVVNRLIQNRQEYEQRNAKRAPKENAYLTGQKQFIQEI
jgi:ethanolamine-phosphate cytidylyltransferase